MALGHTEGKVNLCFEEIKIFDKKNLFNISYFLLLNTPLLVHNSFLEVLIRFLRT